MNRSLSVLVGLGPVPGPDRDRFLKKLLDWSQPVQTGPVPVQRDHLAATGLQANSAPN